MKIALVIGASYLLGSIPFGVLVGNARGVDVRKHGSGNIGFSNVLRVLGPGPASLVLVADVLKGAVPVLLGRWLLMGWDVEQADLWLLAIGFAPILGHTLSVFLGFRGGRAVATAVGVLLGMVWQAGLVGLGVWAIVVGISRYISVASIWACAAVPVYLAATGVRWEWAAFWTAVAALVIARHIPNLRRLAEGTESKIGERARAEEGG
ncbi:MAG TPA: glycerol-3-phosphate 1-O-acyltransferase PlsY [Armatimonadota bacterium]|nr:glycerol-3-phosphate 1-O-acyltransferase PlsY [Armatimonadota bacterium]